MAYRLLYDRVLSRADPESVHVATLGSLRALGRVPGARALLARRTGPPDPRLTVDAFGLTFPSPLGVAAGLDKDAGVYRELGALGFGFVEVGTVTAQAQPGNPRPRITRLPLDRALVNSMGFPSAGADAAARRLRHRPPAPIVAVNVGRTRSATDPLRDYRASAAALAPHADLLVLNVSSPNTPGLRELQGADTLTELVTAVRAEIPAGPPLLVKIAPDLSDAELDALVDAALSLHLDGLIATNTTTDRTDLLTLDVPPQGGVSGAPMKARSLQVLRHVRHRAHDRLTLISVGGIETPDDVLARIRAGATLVQAYTGFVHGGPGWPAQITRGLASRLDGLGVARLSDLIGTEPTA